MSQPTFLPSEYMTLQIILGHPLFCGFAHASYVQNALLFQLKHPLTLLTSKGKNGPEFEANTGSQSPMAFPSD